MKPVGKVVQKAENNLTFLLKIGNII